MRVMTYNIQSGRTCAGILDLTCCEKTIRACAPDICALNEVRMRTRDVGDVLQAKQLGERLNMNWRFAKAIPYNGGEYGVALLSRYPIGETSVYPVPELPEPMREKEYEPRVIFRCEVEAEDGPIAVYVTHFGLSAAEREQAVSLAEALLSRETLPALFMGDLNMTPSDPMVARLEKRIRNTAPGTPFNTHPADAPAVKIDYIFASDDFAVERTWTENTLSSDHLPHLAELRRA